MIFLYIYVVGFFVSGYYMARYEWRETGNAGNTFGIGTTVGLFWPIVIPAAVIAEACLWIGKRKLHVRIMNWTLGPQGEKK